ncbi:hypothetical protein EAS61_38910 [Bradyrhizobium zhanjiangense]|uniref:Uncharacterized protein n=1 Tax=Bradyrhizobium zhanjiangense TaxID=1325107 RepID=A0A4Q0Q6A1_9BRAD|nr:hypothetical protein EAS61_38910 [Bradyrhizobium zhanjiangense]
MPDACGRLARDIAKLAKQWDEARSTQAPLSSRISAHFVRLSGTTTESEAMPSVPTLAWCVST